MGLINVTLSSDMYDEPFLAQRNIKTQSIRGKNKPYFYEVEREPLTFKLSFAFLETWDENKIRSIARWLDQDYYKEFYMSDNPNKRYFTILNGDSRLVHNGLKQGYVELEFLCDSSYAYSPVYETELFDFTTNPLIFNDNLETGTFNNTENNPSLILVYYFSWNDNEGKDETTGFDETKEYTLENDASEFWNDWLGVSFPSYVNTGERTSNPINLSSVKFSTETKISWNQTKPSNTTINIETSINNGLTWQTATNGNTIPGIQHGMNLTNINLLIKITLSTTNALVTPTINSLAITSKRGVTINNEGDTIIYPEIYLTKVSSTGNINLINTDDNNLNFLFESIVQNEELYIDNENEHIETSEVGIYRYDKFNNNYLRLIRDENVIEVNSGFKVIFRYRYKYLQS